MATERMEDGTARMDAGTARMDAGTARMDGSKGGAAATAGVVFVSGQTIVLNDKNCLIDSVISGSTGEAIVYKVIIDNKPYALKLYKPNMPLSDTAKKVITKIKDAPKDRVIKIFDFGKYNEQDFEIMEYAEGGTLDQYIKSSGAIRDTTKIKNIVKMITEGLEQLHNEHKVIYQDLKPENIYFKDANKTSLVLADFGISSIMEGYEKEVEVTASITDLYAAPELARMGNEIKVIVTPAIDYFALGITMFELWLGEKPFKGIKGNSLRNMIRNEEIDFPMDMPGDYATIIQGLIRSKPKDRWGNEQVRKWLKGEALTLESKASQKEDSAVYESLKFSNTESAKTPKDLAALMEKYPDIGKTVLYDGIIKEWCKKAGDLELYNKIQNITSQYNNAKDAGLYTAILALDPERPFRSQGGKICKTGEDIANAIMAESAYYMEDLKKPNANLYVYLAETEGPQGKEAADIFCKNFKEYTPKRALALVYFKLQGDGGITIGNKRYQSPEELKNETDSAQIDLIKKAVNEKDSMLLVWLSDIYGDNLKSTNTFNNLSVPEQFFLLGLLPFLSFREFSYACWDALRYLIDSCPGRADLFEIYAAQGLPLTGQNLDGRSLIGYVVFRFNELSKKHGTDTIRNMIRLLCKLGADVNEYSGDGTNPLINAYNAKKNDLAKLLLELGADENQYLEYNYNKLVQAKNLATTENNYQHLQELAKNFLDMNGYKDTKALADDCENQIRIIKERHAEQERRDRERREEQARRDREERERQEAARRREEAERKREEAREIRNTKLGHFFQFVPVVVGAAFIIITFILADQYVYTPVVNLVLTILGTVVPLILIYNYKLFVLSIIIFFAVLAILIGTFFAQSELMPLLKYLLIGSISMIAAFILMLVYPKEKGVKRLTGILIPVIAVLLMPGYFLVRQAVSFLELQYYSHGNSIIIPAGVTAVNNDEYTRKGLINIEIPDSVTSIGDNAFKKNKLAGVIIPGSVTSIGEKAFADNKLKSITIGSKVTIGSGAFGSGFEDAYKNNSMEAGTYKLIEKNEGGWVQMDGGDIIVPNSNFAEKLGWLQRCADSNNTYIVKLSAGETIPSYTLEYQDTSNVTVVLKGDNANRVIGLKSQGTMFTIRPNVNLVLDNNITLKGLNDNDNAMIIVEGGTLKMNTGSTITGNRIKGRSTGGVYVASGTFEMLGGTISGNSTTHWWGGGVQVGGGNFTMSGGTISGNTANFGGGVQVHHNGRRGGTFIMKGGTISGNTAREAGGGVYVNGDVDGSVGGTFIMSDGTITGNTANKHGGGVFIHNNQKNVPTAFTKNGGTITGYNSAPNTGNVVKNNSGVVSRRGHAVSFGGENLLRRKETTAGPGMNFTLVKNNTSGAWD